MTGELGEILIIFSMPDEGLYADLKKPALMSHHHSRVNFPKNICDNETKKAIGLIF